MSLTQPKHVCLSTKSQNHRTTKSQATPPASVGACVPRCLGAAWSMSWRASFFQHEFDAPVYPRASE